MKFKIKKKQRAQICISFILCGLIVLFGSTLGYGFVPHHDGLILTNVEFLYNSILNGGPWPFNQYGSIWILPYVVIRAFFGRENLLYSLRVVTLFFYFLSSYLLFKTALSVYGRKVGILSVFLFLATQPFAFDLLPWPSSIANLIFLTMVYLAMKLANGVNRRKARFYMFFLGVLSLMLVLSRVQFGLITLLVSFTLLARYSIRSLTPFLSGVLGSSLALGLLAKKLGWLEDLVNDSFIFPSRYLFWNWVNHPKPFGLIGATGLAIAMLSVIYFAGKSNNPTFIRFVGFLPFPIFLVGVSSAYAFLAPHDTNLLSKFYNFFAIKFWMSLVLGSVLLMIFNYFWVKSHRKRYVGAKIQEYILLLSAIISLTQMWPLFDPMHFWWGASIGFILFSNILVKLYTSKNQRNLLISLGILIILPFITVRAEQYVTNFEAINSNNSSSLLKNIRTDAQGVNTRESLFKLTAQNIPRYSVILNLCEDTTIFLSDAQYRSASRFYVYWSNLMSLNETSFRKLIQKPDAIIVCSPILTKESPGDLSMKKAYIEKLTRNSNTKNLKYVESEYRTWDLIVLVN